MPARLPVAVVVFVASVASALSPRSAAAQGSSPGAPIEVSASPGLARPGTPVTISGRTFVDGKRLHVAITVQPPSGVPAKLTATANVKTGKYTVTFSKTDAPGEYKVTAVSPDGKGTAQGSFTIATTGSLLSAAASTLQSAIVLSAEAIGDAKKDVAALPPSPASQELTQKLQTLDAQLKKLEAPIPEIKKGAAAVAKAAEASPEVAKATEADLDAIADWAAEREVDRIRQRLQSARESKVSTCDQIELANEALTAVSLALVFTARGASFFVKLFLNNGLPAAVNAIPPAQFNDAQKHATTEGVKVAAAAAKSFADLVGSTQDLVGDTTQYILKGVFAKYCVKFEGPVIADFDVTFLEGVQPWLKYDVKLEGRIVLRYEKNAPAGKPIRLTGEIEGNATHFGFKEDVFVVEERPKGAIVMLRQPLPAVPFVNSTKDPLGFGQFARMGTPAYFYVPIEGELVKDTIVLKILDAKVDFTDLVKNRLVLIFVAPALPIPIIKTFDFPIQKAQFILSRGMQNTPDFKVTVAGNKQAIERKFIRNHVSQDGEVKVNFAVVVKATSG